jgi:hypothetical protein
MTTDLEAEIRDTLHTRAQAVTTDSLRYPDGPRRERPSRARETWSVVAVAAVVAALTIIVAIRPWQTDNDGATSSGGQVPAANTSWQLVSAYSPNGGIASGAGLRASLTFNPNEHLLGRDGVGAIDATIVPTSGGFRVTTIGATGSGYAGHNRRVVAVKSAMDAIFFDCDGGTVDVESHVRGDRLTLQVSGDILQFHRL